DHGAGDLQAQRRDPGATEDHLRVGIRLGRGPAPLPHGTGRGIATLHADAIYRWTWKCRRRSSGTVQI
ncbi:hypothetical protein CEE74_12065, partial [Lactobacillus crispatus]